MRKFAYFATAMLLMVFAVMLVSRAQPPSESLLREFRPIGGGHNNLLHPEFDATPGRPELAIAPLRHAMPDGPNARTVSNVIAGGDDSQTTDSVASAWLYVFGQFVDHDLGLETSIPSGPRIDIPVPPGDPMFPHGGERAGILRPFQRTDTMSALPPCPKCNSEFTYEDGANLVCPECGHEWSSSAAAPAEDGPRVYRDSAGNVLQDGDTVTVIKDLKLKGGGGTVKMGTKVKNIRLVDSDHDIDCKIDGFGAMSLKTEFVKKV